MRPIRLFSPPEAVTGATARFPNSQRSERTNEMNGNPTQDLLPARRLLRPSSSPKTTAYLARTRVAGSGAVIGYGRTQAQQIV